MKLRVLSLHFRESQKYRDKEGDWKSYGPGELMMVDLGSTNHYGVQCRAGVRSQEIRDISKVRRHIAALEDLSTEDRIKWFADTYTDARIYYFAESLLGDRSGPTQPISVAGSFDLRWTN